MRLKGKLRLMRKLKELNKLKRRLEKLEKEYQELSERYQPQIDKSVEKANILAEDFKRSFRCSQDFFRVGNRRSADNFSNQGRIAQEKCEKINKIVNQMRYHLGILFCLIKIANIEIKRIEREIRFLSESVL